MQSTGWAGMVKIVRVVSYSSYGAVMGVISMSYLLATPRRANLWAS